MACSQERRIYELQEKARLDQISKNPSDFFVNRQMIAVTFSAASVFLAPRY
jgi:hypothetical protein